MKRFVLLALAILFSLVSCSDDDSDKVVYWGQKIITVEANEWELYYDANGLNPYYVCEKLLPELNRDVYANGNVNAYLFQTIDGVEVQTPLPYILPLENRAGEEWIESCTFDFSPGYVAFYVRYSDFFVDNAPQRQVFRIIMTL